MLLFVPSTAQGQGSLEEGEGTASLEGWPRSLHELLEEMGNRAPYLLPRIDSLALDYRYAVTDTTSRWSFVLSWRPGERVLYEGEVLPWRERPRDIHMTNVEFRADVRVDGDARAQMVIGVDSMALRPGPDRFVFNVTVPHDRVFVDTSPTEARRLLSQGITLEPLIVERMGFGAANVQRDQSSDIGRGPENRPQEPKGPSIYTPRTNVFIGWRVGPRPYYVGNRDGDSGDERPRRGTVGQATQGDDSAGDESGRRGGEASEEGADSGSQGSSRGRSSGSSDDDDDEDDDADLLVPALGAVVAVAAVGYAGGTVGLYGRGDTPIGLAAGRTTPGWGIQLQASINSEVIEDTPGQKLSAQALGFYDVFGARVQPAAGLGVTLDPQRNRNIRPSLSAGLVGNFGRIVLYGGADVIDGRPEVGISYNFRHGSTEESSAGEEPL